MLVVIALASPALAGADEADHGDLGITPFDLEIDGQTIHDRAPGPKTGAPVLLLHGAGLRLRQVGGARPAR
jgi:hypothetical protein